MRWVHCIKYLYCDWPQQCHVMKCGRTIYRSFITPGILDHNQQSVPDFVSHKQANQELYQSTDCFTFPAICKTPNKGVAIPTIAVKMKCLVNIHYSSQNRNTTAKRKYWTRLNSHPDTKVHGANMGPTWVLSAPDGPHVRPMNLAIRAVLYITMEASTTENFCWTPDDSSANKGNITTVKKCCQY